MYFSLSKNDSHDGLDSRGKGDARAGADILRKGSVASGASTWYKLEHSTSPWNNKFSLNLNTDRTIAAVQFSTTLLAYLHLPDHTER